MLKNKSLINTVEEKSSDRPVQKKKFFSIVNRPLLSGALVFFILAGLFSLLVYQRYKLAQETRVTESIKVLNEVKDNIQKALSHSLSAARTLTFLIDGDGAVNNFYTVAKQILELENDIDVLQLVPGGVIQYVYPLLGNESVLGYDILLDSTRNKEAYKAIEKKQFFFAGPLALKQGGTGIIGRLPVYRNNKFWGFSAVVIKMSTLLKTAGIDSSGSNGYYFQFSKINPDSKIEEYFLPPQPEQSNSRSVSLKISDGEWQLSVVDIKRYRGFNDMALLAFAGLLLSLLGGISVYRFAKRPEKLNELVKARTSDLQISENNYRSLIERVSDAFVSLDKDWKYTYVNQKAAEIFGRDAKSLIGKNIWTEFPEEVDKPFYHAYYRAMETQDYQYIEEYYSPYGKWFENHIYPAADGLTIFFKDVTEIKKITQVLKNKEEKYRSLIEQASDGIVITDMEGIILEVNNSMLSMIGFDEEETIGHHLVEYLPEEDTDDIPLRIHELLQGKSLLYERRVLKKDGTVLDVEVNSKMASSHTLIGFIRDISGRKKSEEALRISNERFGLIAEATNDAVWDHDLIKNKTWGNNKLYKLYGSEPDKEQINFEMFIERIHPDQRNGIKERLSNAIKNSETSVSEIFQFKTASGTYRTFFDRATIQYNSAGAAVRILGSMHDITESENAQKAILESEERYRVLVENAPEALVVLDFETQKFVSVSDSASSLFGLPKEELLKLGPIELSPEYQPDGRPSADAAKDYIIKAVNGEKSSFEWTHIRNDGTAIQCELWLVKLPSESKTLIRGSIIDISERKHAEQKIYQSEQKYKLLFYNNPLPMWMTTLPGLDIIDVNDAAIKQYGYSREEFLKLNTRQLRPVEDVETFLKEVDKMQPDIINIRNWRHQKKDGTVIQVETYSHQIMYEGQRAWLGLSHDVTEKNEAKELLQQSYEDIRQLASNLQSIREEERTNIAREIHDELGQQLTGLKMDLHWLIKKISNNEQEIQNKLGESVELINATIATVRKISTDLRPSILDDLGLIAALEWQAKEFQKRSGTKVEFINNAGNISIEPEVATAIFRIFQELLTNIARHANATFVQVELKKNERNLYFSLNDNGVGFDPDSIKNKKTLGLLGIKERSLLLGGTYEIKSAPGKGSVTNISVPVNFITNTN